MRTRAFTSSLMIVASTVAGEACTYDAGDRAGSAESTVAGVPVGDVRGVADISDTLRTRLLDDGDPAAVTFDVSRVAGDAVFGLRRHLGSFASSGAGTQYQGGLVTPFRAALWHQVFAHFADAVGRVCDASDGATLNLPVYSNATEPGSAAGLSDADGASFRLAPAVLPTIRAACASEGDEHERQTAASALFDVVMGHGATLAAERSAFVEAFAADASHAVGAPRGERVYAMILVLLFNPHFLLSK